MSRDSSGENARSSATSRSRLTSPLAVTRLMIPCSNRPLLSSAPRRTSMPSTASSSSDRCTVSSPTRSSSRLVAVLAVRRDHALRKLGDAHHLSLGIAACTDLRRPTAYHERAAIRRAGEPVAHMQARGQEPSLMTTTHASQNRELDRARGVKPLVGIPAKDRSGSGHRMRPLRHAERAGLSLQRVDAQAQRVSSASKARGRTGARGRAGHQEAEPGDESIRNATESGAMLTLLSAALRWPTPSWPTSGRHRLDSTTHRCDPMERCRSASGPREGMVPSDVVVAPAFHHLFQAHPADTGATPRWRGHVRIALHCCWRPSLEFEHKEASSITPPALRAGDPDARSRPARHPAINELAPEHIRLVDAQFILAREYGFTSWPHFVRYFGDVDRQRYNHRSIQSGGATSTTDVVRSPS